MGKRGPKQQGVYQNRTAVMSTKITPELRASLVAACKSSGASLSSEVEHRLRRSFSEGQKLDEALGGRQIYAILRLIAATLAMTGPIAYGVQTNRLNFSPAEWLLDPFAYDQAFKAVVTILNSLRPPGSAAPRPITKSISNTKETRRLRKAFLGIRDEIGEGFAGIMLEHVMRAEPGLPLPTQEWDDIKLAQYIANDLGPIVNHIHDPNTPLEPASNGPKAKPRRKKK